MTDCCLSKLVTNCCLSEVEIQRRHIDKEIDRIILKDKKEARKELKLLLLGTGESGKSTFIRQMRIINGTGFSVSDKLAYVKTIFGNIISSMQIMIDAMEALRLDYGDVERSYQSVQLLRSLDYQNIHVLTAPITAAIKQLWSDSGMQQCFQRRNEYQLPDSTKYYLTELDRIATSDYLPTEIDILHVRAPTTGILEYVFDLDMVRFRYVAQRPLIYSIIN